MEQRSPVPTCNPPKSIEVLTREFVLRSGRVWKHIWWIRGPRSSKKVRRNNSRHCWGQWRVSVYGKWSAGEHTNLESFLFKSTAFSVVHLLRADWEASCQMVVRKCCQYCIRDWGSFQCFRNGLKLTVLWCKKPLQRRLTSSCICACSWAKSPVEKHSCANAVMCAVCLRVNWICTGNSKQIHGTVSEILHHQRCWQKLNNTEPSDLPFTATNGACALWKGGKFSSWSNGKPCSQVRICNSIASFRIISFMGMLAGGGSVPRNCRINRNCC